MDKKSPTQWHPAFYSGIQIELKEYEHILSFENEHALTKKPLLIDVLIIKKRTEEPINKNLGRIFLKHNIVEYKSPTDYVSIDDYYKVIGYACLYKQDVRTANEIKQNEITITLVSRRYPRTLISHLKTERNLIVEKQDSGIYYVKGCLFPAQIIVTKELSMG